MKLCHKKSNFPKYLEATSLSKTGNRNRIWLSKYGNGNKMWTSKMGTGTKLGLQILVPEQNPHCVPVPIFEVHILFRYQFLKSTFCSGYHILKAKFCSGYLFLRGRMLPENSFFMIKLSLKICHLSSRVFQKYNFVDVQRGNEILTVYKPYKANKKENGP